MKTYFITEQRDGNQPKNIQQLFTDTMSEAKIEFSKVMLSDIARSDEYNYYTNEDEFKSDYGKDATWKGAGYYATEDALLFGREEFYAKNSIFDTYRDDVYTYSITEEEETN